MIFFKRFVESNIRWIAFSITPSMCFTNPSLQALQLHTHSTKCIFTIRIFNWIFVQWQEHQQKNSNNVAYIFSTLKNMRTILKFTDRLNGTRIIFTILTMEIAMNFITDKCLFFIIFVWFFCMGKPRYAMLDHSLNIISEPETTKSKQKIFSCGNWIHSK